MQYPGTSENKRSRTNVCAVTSVKNENTIERFERKKFVIFYTSVGVGPDPNTEGLQVEASLPGVCWFLVSYIMLGMLFLCFFSWEWDTAVSRYPKRKI